MIMVIILRTSWVHGGVNYLATVKKKEKAEFYEFELFFVGPSWD